MKIKKARRLKTTSDGSPQRRAEGQEAPAFLVRLVGKTRAKSLCREEAAHPRRD